MSAPLPQSVDEMTDILDIEGIHISLTPDYIKGALILLATLAVVVLLVLLIKKIIQRFAATKHLSPEERAQQSLKRLKKMDLIGKGDSPGFYFNLDEIFRRYLLEKFTINVLDKTYEQIKSNMTVLQGLFSGVYLETLNAYLDRAQFVKFAKVTVGREEAVSDFKFVEDFVHRSREKAGES